MAFILTVTLAALALIALGALGALALRLRSELTAAQAEIDALKARLAAPTVWAGLGPEWSEAQAVSADFVARPLAATALPTPDFAAGPQAWLVDPPEPGVPGPVHPAPPTPRNTAYRRGRSVRRALDPDTLESGLFPTWNADAAFAGLDSATANDPAPGAAVGAALGGVYAMTAAAGARFGWPWALTLGVLLLLAGMMAAGFWRAEKSVGLCAATVMAGAAPWTAALVGAPLAVMTPVAAGLVALGALVGLGRRQPALLWTAAGLALAGAGAYAAFSVMSGPVVGTTAPAALAAATLAVLGVLLALVAPEAQARRGAAALHAAAFAALAAGAMLIGVDGAFGWGLAFAVAATLVLATGPARDAALITAWLAACVGLFALSGDPLASAAMTPAAALAGAGFLGAGLARTPRPDGHGLVLFALAAAAPLAAVPLALTGPAAALGFAGVAALLGLGFARAAQAQGGAENVTLAAWPLALGAAAAGAGALLAAAPSALVGPLAAAAALSLSLLAARTRAGALAASAGAVAVFSVIAVLDAVRVAPGAAAGWAGAVMAVLALLTGAWLASTRRLGGAPATGVALAAAGIVTALAAPLILFPAIVTELRGAGAVASGWLAMGFVLYALGDPEGAARRAGLAVAALGAALAGWALLISANPWWSAGAAPLPAGAAGLVLMLGAGFPALLCSAVATSAALRRDRRSALGFGAAALVLTVAGAALALRSAAYGPAGLSEPGLSSLELIGLTLTLAGVGAALALTPSRTARRAGLALLAVATAKFTLLDLHAAGFAPALASAVLGVVLLGAAIAGRDWLRSQWTAPPASPLAPARPKAPAPASP